jgi:hypothetical protein
MSHDVSTHLDGAGAWPDLLGAGGLLAVRVARWTRLAYLEPLTDDDTPTVGVLAEIFDGGRVFAHLSWAELYHAVQALAERHGVPGVVASDQ